MGFGNPYIFGLEEDTGKDGVIDKFSICETKSSLIGICSMRFSMMIALSVAKASDADFDFLLC